MVILLKHDITEANQIQQEYQKLRQPMLKKEVRILSIQDALIGHNGIVETLHEPK